MDSKVALTHYERNDAGWEGREEGSKTEERSKREEKNIGT